MDISVAFLLRCLLVSGIFACRDACAGPLIAVRDWMSDPDPMTAASIVAHFGVPENAVQCVENGSGQDCFVHAKGLDARWRRDNDRQIRDGYLRVQLEGCTSRKHVEEVLAIDLRFEPSGTMERNALVTLSDRFWVPGMIWRINVVMDRQCTSNMTVAIPPF